MKGFLHKVKLTARNCARYLPLLRNLISRELKKKYRQSILGYAWCVLNPLLVMLIMNFVFSAMFHNSIENYPVYLFTGRMLFSFITESTTSTCRSVVSNGALMRKTRIPYYIFPLSNFCSSIVNFLFSLVAFAVVLVFTGTPISIHVLAFPLVVLEMFLFCFGLGLFLSQAQVFVRDTGYIYSVLTTGWMYLTPLFYPITQLTQGLQYAIVHFNPAYFYISQGRDIFLYHQWPDPTMMLKGAVAGVVFLLIGLITYARSKDNLILYV